MFYALWPAGGAVTNLVLFAQGVVIVISKVTHSLVYTPLLDP